MKIWEHAEKERFIGPYRCDIVCKDEETHRVVLIENQFGESNHDHLGKIITYASGLNAKVIVWIVKEAKEEAGAEVEPNFVIALSDWKSHIPIKFENLPFQICKVFVMCDLKNMNFKPNSETLQADFFDRDNLPDIAVGKNSKDQIELCFKAYDAVSSGKHWDTVFD